MCESTALDVNDVDIDGENSQWMRTTSLFNKYVNILINKLHKIMNVLFEVDYI